MTWLYTLFRHYFAENIVSLDQQAEYLLKIPNMITRRNYNDMRQPQNYYTQTFPSFKVKVHYTFQYRTLTVQTMLNQAPLSE